MSKTVTAADVRAAFATGTLEVPDHAVKSVQPGTRGRIHKDAIEAFLKANPGTKFQRKTMAEHQQTIVEVPYVKPNAKGAKRRYVAKVSATEVRALAGEPVKRGRLSQATIAKAGEALSKR